MSRRTPTANRKAARIRRVKYLKKKGKKRARKK